jgi:hypothetical protein
MHVIKLKRWLFSLKRCVFSLKRCVLSSSRCVFSFKRRMLELFAALLGQSRGVLRSFDRLLRLRTARFDENRPSLGLSALVFPVTPGRSLRLALLSG